MAISQNFTDEYPSLSIDFAKSQKLDPRILFTRSTSGSFIDETGQLKTLPADTPRFCFDFRTQRNLLPFTETFVPWSEIEVGGSVTTTGFNATAPDGTTTASLVTATAGGSGAESIYQDVFARGNGTYTASIFVKAGTQTSVVLSGFFLYDQQQGFNFRFNPVTGTIISTNGGSNHTVVRYPNDWYRIYFTFTGTVAGNDYLRFQVYFQTSGTVFLWAPQLEEGSTVTEYVHTTTSNVRKPTSSGLLIEPPSTNFSRFSETFTDSWSNGAGGSGTKYLNNSPTLTSSAGVTPDGTNTATRMVASQGAARITTILSAAPGTTKATPMCYSVFVKPNGTSKVRLDLVNNVNIGSGDNYTYRVSGTFHLTGNGSFDTPIITANTDATVSPYGFATIEPLLNNWYRVSLSFRTYNGAGTLLSTLSEIRFNENDVDILIWGDQFENHSYPTSYKKTTGSTVSTGGDLASIIGSGFTRTYNPYEGTFFAEFTPKGTLGNDLFGGVFGVSSQTDPAPFNFLILNPYNAYGQYVATRSQTINSSSIGTFNSAVNVKNKLAGSYSINSYESFFNGIGTTPAINVNALVYDFDSFILGRNFYTSGSFGNLVLSKVSYYPKKLNSLQLKSLTQ
jgi:hypothetical protein